MRKYLVRFWWVTDNRAEQTVEAMNEISALCKALEGIRMPDGWVTGPNFKVTIEYVL